MAYAECFALMLPLRERAERCGVCPKTAYTMRHRLIECSPAYSPSFTVERGSGCELDETYFTESFKGNLPRALFSLAPTSPTSWEQVHKRGLSSEQICVMTEINDSNETFFEISGRGILSRRRAMNDLKGRIKAGPIVATDKVHAYSGVLSELNVALHTAYDPKAPSIALAWFIRFSLRS